MKTLPDNSVDAIVSDPPYGISFMAKKWDYDVPKVEVWQEAMRVLKPGGHALIACGTRTQHRMVVNIEDAGFEIRDVVSWIYGSGFPKSLNISKAIDKAAGAERDVTGYKKLNEKDKKTYIPNGKDQMFKGLVQGDRKMQITAPATEAAKQWDGWGTALKPSSEFFTLCRKPLSEKTIAANVLKWGTGGINIDGSRVGMSDEDNFELMAKSSKNPTGVKSGFGGGIASKPSPQGRFPANLIHDGSQEVLDLFPETKSGVIKDHHKKSSLYGRNSFNKSSTVSEGGRGFGDQGSAARFFYCAKASKKDRDEGNNHPTVKPTALMQYLCRLITPTGGTVLDPYMGSGSTGKAAIKEGFDFIGCELDPDYFNIAETRINNEIK
jgi:site-specific DNA-methyltransferase (adenine-specific)